MSNSYRKCSYLELGITEEIFNLDIFMNKIIQGNSEPKKNVCTLLRSTGNWFIVKPDFARPWKVPDQTFKEKRC